MSVHVKLVLQMYNINKLMSIYTACTTASSLYILYVVLLVFSFGKIKEGPGICDDFHPSMQVFYKHNAHLEVCRSSCFHCTLILININMPGRSSKAAVDKTVENAI